MSSPFVVPDGWEIHADGYGRDADVVQSPGPIRYMATIDWKRRGFRGGMTTYGDLLGDATRYKGLGWQQRLVDDVVAWLRALQETCP